VAKDNTVTFEGSILQIPKTSPFRSYAHKRIDVHVLLNGAVEFFYKTERIATFDSKTTHTIGYIERTVRRWGSALWSDFYAGNSTSALTLTYYVAVNLTY
jgi:hypothetical protein